MRKLTLWAFLLLCISLHYALPSTAYAFDPSRTYIHIGADPINPRLCDGVAGSRKQNPNYYRARIIDDLYGTTVGKSGKKTSGYIPGESTSEKNDGTEVLVKNGVIVAICKCGNPILNETIVADNRSPDPPPKKVDRLEHVYEDSPPPPVAQPQPVQATAVVAAAVIEQKQPEELPCIGKGTIETTVGSFMVAYGIKLLFIPTPPTWAIGALLTLTGGGVSWLGANENDSKPVCKFIGGVIGGVGGAFTPGPSVHTSSQTGNGGGPSPQPTNGPAPGGPSPSPVN